MPQLDLDHLLCVGARGSGFTDSSMSKVACETTAAALPDAGAVQRCGSGGAGSAADDAVDAPAESFLIRISDGVCLPHSCGGALRRDGSTKGSSNPKAAAEAATRKGAPSAADPRRSSLACKTAAVIGVLPASKVVANKERRVRVPGRAVALAWRLPVPVPVPAAGARVFASEAVQGPEPVSPKVSCFGAVLSERSAAAPPAGAQGEEEGSGGGCWASLGTALLGHLSAASEPDSKDIGMAPPPEPQRVAVMSPPPLPVAGLGDVKRLASRRWPDTMARGTV